jgi:hypothetical protein
LQQNAVSLAALPIGLCVRSGVFAPAEIEIVGVALAPKRVCRPELVHGARGSFTRSSTRGAA